MTDGLRIAHLRIAPQLAILRWAFLTFTFVPFAQTFRPTQITNIQNVNFSINKSEIFSIFVVVAETFVVPDFRKLTYVAEV